MDDIYIFRHFHLILQFHYCQQILVVFDLCEDALREVAGLNNWFCLFMHKYLIFWCNYEQTHTKNREFNNKFKAKMHFIDNVQQILVLNIFWLRKQLSSILAIIAKWNWQEIVLGQVLNWIAQMLNLIHF